MLGLPSKIVFPEIAMPVPSHFPWEQREASAARCQPRLWLQFIPIVQPKGWQGRALSAVPTVAEGIEIIGPIVIIVRFRCGWTSTNGPLHRLRWGIIGRAAASFRQVARIPFQNGRAHGVEPWGLVADTLLALGPSAIARDKEATLLQDRSRFLRIEASQDFTPAAIMEQVAGLARLNVVQIAQRG